MESRDLVLKINTGEGIATYLTDLLNGEIEAIIIRSRDNFDLKIESELGYVLFNKRDCFGDVYMPLRTREIDTDGHGYQEGSNFYINERLIIQVIGGKDKQIEVILRFS